MEEEAGAVGHFFAQAELLEQYPLLGSFLADTSPTGEEPL